MPPRRTQDNRLMAISSPLGEDVLLLTSLQGQEALSTLYSFQLELVSEDHNIIFENIIGEAVSIDVESSNGESRFFHGLIASFSQGQGLLEPDTDVHLASYSATLVPWFWLLTRTTDSRIFQELTVPDIIEKIFSEKGMQDYELHLQGSYDPRTYCVQYRETDYNFICRLMEEEGIFFFFKHEEDKHTLIIADSADEHQPCENQEIARYNSGTAQLEEEEVITNLERTQEITFGKYTVNDFNFTIPTTDLKVEVESRVALGPGERELYDYPGEYESRSRGDHLANLRMQAEEARITSIHGASNCCQFTSGYKFTLEEYFRSDMNDEDYVLTAVSHSATQSITTTGGGGGGDSYSNTFSCIPFAVVFRPQLNAPKPLIAGNQTATVVGPSGEEIHTDEHGRVKVQFPWDREGQNDDKSSCWIRVSQAWAGTGWGAMFIPRIGQEVIVDFLEGDPDRPIITGRVYHGINTPPYSLPGDKTKSTIKSNSSKGGGGSNEIRFEDKKGSEEIYIHAQKDMNSKIENNQTWNVGVNKTTNIGNNQKTTINGNHTREIKGNSTKKTIGNITKQTTGNITKDTVGNITEKVGGARKTDNTGQKTTMNFAMTDKTTVGLTNETFIGGKNSKTIAATNEMFVGVVVKNTVAATMENYVGVKVSACAAHEISKSGSLRFKETPMDVTKATSAIKLSSGGSSITITPGAIVIKSAVVTIEGTSNVILKSGAAIQNKPGIKSNKDSFFDKALHAKNFKSM